MTLNDFAYDRTVSARETIIISYGKEMPDGSIVPQKATLYSTPVSETITKYSEYWAWKKVWKGADGQLYGEQDRQWLADSKEAYTRTTMAAVCGGLVKAMLEKGLGLPSGDVEKYTYTDYEYKYFDGSFVCVKEVQEVWTEYWEIVGSLSFQSYEPLLKQQTPAAGTLVRSHVTETEYLYGYEISDQGGYGLTKQSYSRTKVSRWMLAAFTQEGQAAIAEMLKSEDGSGTHTQNALDAAMVLRFDGVELSSSIGKHEPYSRPDDADIAANQIDNGDSGQEKTEEVDAVPSFTSESNNNNEPPSASMDFGSNVGSYDIKNESGDWSQMAKSFLPPSDPDYQPGFAQSLAEPASWTSYKADPGDPHPWFDSQGVAWRDSDADGVPDWAMEVPGAAIGGLALRDSDGDGLPDWAENLPGDWAGSRGDGPALHAERLGPAFVEYNMPFAPDDYFRAPSQYSWPNVIRGHAAAEAGAYGRTQFQLAVASAFGFNISASPFDLPLQPLRSIYLEALGLRVEAKMNGISWAFGNNGVVVSADLLYVGLVGRLPES